MSHRSSSKTGAASAFAGAALLLVGTLLHPSHAHPNDTVAAFTEYAADQAWVASHLTQLLGVVLLFTALSLFGRRFTTEIGATFVHIGSVFASASIAMAAALQAVDGIALKAMVNAWAIAPAADKATAFASAVAVRQIEIGLASMFALLSGITVLLFALAILSDRRLARWLGWLGAAAGAATVSGGALMACTGFSDSAMLINMPANVMLLCWALALGVWMWRRE